jgi:hypothetical protein
MTDENEEEIRQLHERVMKALETFSIDDLRQLVHEIEELARSEE